MIAGVFVFSRLPFCMLIPVCSDSRHSTQNSAVVRATALFRESYSNGLNAERRKLRAKNHETASVLLRRNDQHDPVTCSHGIRLHDFYERDHWPCRLALAAPDGDPVVAPGERYAVEALQRLRRH